MPYVPCLLLPVVVSLLAWCRRRNVGVLTWMLRIAPIAVVFTYPISVSAVWLCGLCYMALLRDSMFLAVIVLIPLVAICAMIVRWRGWRVNTPHNQWLRVAFCGAYACGSAIIALALMIVSSAVGFGGFMAYECRTIDCLFSTNGEMARSSKRAARFAEWFPPTATDIRYSSEAKIGECTERLTCHCEEADLLRFAVEHSYPLATNSFTMLDYYIPEQDASYVYEQMEKDAETQQRLVFGEKPLPQRYISLTQSHAFDGGACGGRWRVIFVLDRDTNELTGYHWANWL